MGVLRYAGVAAVDDPSDTGSTEASQHPIPYRSTMARPLIKCDSASRQEKIATLNPSNTSSEGAAKTGSDLWVRKDCEPSGRRLQPNSCRR